MKTTLIQSQIDDYRKNGFLVIDEFLTPEELAVWRCAVDDAVAAKCPPARNNEYYDNVFQQRVNLWRTVRRFGSWFLIPASASWLRTWKAWRRCGCVTTRHCAKRPGPMRRPGTWIIRSGSSIHIMRRACGWRWTMLLSRTVACISCRVPIKMPGLSLC